MAPDEKSANIGLSNPPYKSPSVFSLETSQTKTAEPEVTVPDVFKSTKI